MKPAKADAECVHCGQATVTTELLGRCHDASGLYWCNPDAGYAAQTVATIAAQPPTGR